MTAATMAVQAAPRPFYWSVRRELWEHRSVYLGPAIAAGVVLFGFVLASLNGSHVQMNFNLDSGAPRALLAVLPYFIVTGVVLVTGLLVAFAFCLSALNTERRDRSILFWKSLPVSDVTTVLAKAFIPLVAIPVVAFAVIGVTELIVMVVLAIAPQAQGQDTGQVGQAIFSSLIYGPLVFSLWYAPVYGWLLLVSSWAKRGAFLWAVLPPLAICLLEAIVLHTRHFSDLLNLRLNGAFGAVFALSAPGSTDQFHMPQITREQFFTSPDLWLGLVVAAAFIAGAVWMRRRAEPV